jgi:hypothetical protein
VRSGRREPVDDRAFGFRVDLADQIARRGFLLLLERPRAPLPVDGRCPSGELDREGPQLREIDVPRQRAFLYSAAISFSFACVPPYASPRGRYRFGTLARHV